MKNDLHFALLGENVGYSKSPAIFEAMFRAIGREGRFEIHKVAPKDLRGSLNRLKLEGIRGFAVTVPYKQLLLDVMDDLDPVACKVGAVNSVAINDDCFYGYNTDCYGFAYPLMSCGKRQLGSRALIAGCGGGARAAAHSLYVDLGIHHFTILGRNADRLSDFANSFSKLDRVQIETIDITVSQHRQDVPYDIVVNATPAGGWNHPADSPFVVFPESKMYYDLNYNNSNALVVQARQRGMKVLDGSSMLVAQAVKSFEIWTGLQVPFDDIYRAVFGDRSFRVTL